MKISELIEKLQCIYAESGELDVCMNYILTAPPELVDLFVHDELKVLWLENF